MLQHQCGATDLACTSAAGISQMAVNPGERGSIEAEAAGLRRGVSMTAVALSGRRRAAAGHLRVAVESCLAELAMAGSRFDVRIGWEPCPQVMASPERPAPRHLQKCSLCNACSLIADTCHLHWRSALRRSVVVALKATPSTVLSWLCSD